MRVELDPYYEELLQYYTDETDMCNQLGLNYDEIYIYHEDDEEEEDNDEFDDFDEDEEEEETLL